MKIDILASLIFRRMTHNLFTWNQESSLLLTNHALSKSSLDFEISKSFPQIDAK